MTAQARHSLAEVLGNVSATCLEHSACTHNIGIVVWVCMVTGCGLLQSWQHLDADKSHAVKKVSTVGQPCVLRTQPSLHCICLTEHTTLEAYWGGGVTSGYLLHTVEVLLPVAEVPHRQVVSRTNMVGS
jgi:hypothetical protein